MGEHIHYSSKAKDLEPVAYAEKEATKAKSGNEDIELSARFDNDATKAKS